MSLDIMLRRILFKISLAVFFRFSERRSTKPCDLITLYLSFFFLVDKTEINETKYKGLSEVANAQSLSSILNDRGHVTHTTGVRTIGKHKVNPSYNCLWALVMYFWPSAIN